MRPPRDCRANAEESAPRWRIPEEVVGRCFDNQLRLPVLELRYSTGAGGETPCAVEAQRLRGLPNAIPDAVLLDERREPTDAMRIAYMDGNGGGLTQGGDWSGQVYDG